uniref:Uncharacterized protein n=1 Tax=Panagrolaimus sp. PS1159 TaxID=55785 RepID=A0AC35GF74_9BILA
MDLSNSETTPSDILMKNNSNKAPWRRYLEQKMHIFRSTYRLQAFPFRDTLIRYITNNPVSSKVYQKMIQSCKHFFIKNPIIVVKTLYFSLQYKGWFTHGSRPSKNHPNGIPVYLNEITSKIWIADSLNVCWPTPNWSVVTSFMPKIYQCDAADIFIYGQMFSFNDLMVIASKCEMVYLSNVVIMNNDEKVPETEEDQFYFETAVSLEALIKALTNVKTFIYDLPKNSLNIITTKTAEELLKISNFLSLEKFQIREIPETFNLISFYGHIKENKKTKIDLHFSRQISDEYKTRLQTIVDEILQTEIRDYKVPSIYFQR